jgi:ATP-dependent protease ClpP protease subunit
MKTNLKRQQKYLEYNTSSESSGAKNTNTVTKRYFEQCQAIFNSFSDEDFYGPKAHHIFFYGKVDKDQVQKLRLSLHNAQKDVHYYDNKDSTNTALSTHIIGNKTMKYKKKPVVLHIHSPGGVAEFGLTMTNFLTEIDVPLAVVVDGYACSAVTPMLVVAPYRVMHDLSFVMIHESSMTVNDTRQSNVSFSVNQYFAGIVDEYRKVYQNNTQIPQNELKDMMTSDKFLDASVCKRWSIVDRVISLKNTASTKKRWDKFISKNPDLRPSLQALKGDVLNHLFIYDTTAKSANSKEERFDSIMQIVQVLQNVCVNTNASSTIKPFILHSNFQMTPKWNLYDLSTLIIRIHVLPTPVYAVIDSNIDILQALPCIMSYKRYMYSNAKLFVRLNYNHSEFQKFYYHDIKYNTELFRSMITRYLALYTKVPQDILDNLFEKRLMLTAKQCLQYGIIDEIIMAPKRPSAPGLKIQSGGCSCSQGLAYNL